MSSSHMARKQILFYSSRDLQPGTLCQDVKAFDHLVYFSTAKSGQNALCHNQRIFGNHLQQVFRDSKKYPIKPGFHSTQLTQENMQQMQQMKLMQDKNASKCRSHETHKNKRSMQKWQVTLCSFEVSFLRKAIPFKQQ